MFWNPKRKYESTWRGCHFEVTVPRRLSDAEAFDREIRFLTATARSIAQMTRDLNDLAQEQGLVLIVDSMTERRYHARMLPAR